MLSAITRAGLHAHPIALIFYWVLYGSEYADCLTSARVDQVGLFAK